MSRWKNGSPTVKSKSKIMQAILRNARNSWGFCFLPASAEGEFPKIGCQFEKAHP
jgi:hypothetical protein